MSHTYTNLLTHVTFSTKNRAAHIDDDLKPRLLPYMGGILRELGAKAVAINAQPDHVHLLVALPPTLAVADAMRVLKTNSSRWVHEQWPSRRVFGWQTGYGAFSVSRSNVEVVTSYIASQDEHHRTLTFQDEFLTLLKKHGIAYDERYIWE